MRADPAFQRNPILSQELDRRSSSHDRNLHDPALTVKLFLRHYSHSPRSASWPPSGRCPSPGEWRAPTGRRPATPSQSSVSASSSWRSEVSAPRGRGGARGEGCSRTGLPPIRDSTDYAMALIGVEGFWPAMHALRRAGLNAPGGTVLPIPDAARTDTALSVFRPAICVRPDQNSVAV
jgi:hypothetical protein